MCTGRLDLALILRAFAKGADGVVIGGCHLNECNYITHGNFHALAMVHLFKKMMEQLGLNPDRLRMELISGSEGNKFVEIMNEFSREIRDIGPLGAAEGIDEKGLKSKLDAFTKLVPYLRLVERERLRLSLKTEEDFDEYFDSAEFNRIFGELVLDKLHISQITSLLAASPLTTKEISETLNLPASDVSRHLNASSRQGFVRYDSDRKCYSLV